MRGVPPDASYPSQPSELRLPPERALTIALDADGCVRSVVAMTDHDEPVVAPPGTAARDLLPDADGDDAWPERLARLARAPTTSLRFEVAVPHDRDRAMPRPLRRAVTAVPVVGADGELETIVLRLAVAHEVGGLPDPDEERFQFLAETLPQMLWMARPDGTLVYLSPQWSVFSGIAVSQLLADGYHSIVHPDDLPTLDATEQPDGSFLMTPFRLRRHDGAYRWVEAIIRPVRDAQGHLLRTVGTTTDITARIEAGEARRAITEQLKASLAVSGMGRYELDLRSGTATGDDQTCAILGIEPGGEGATMPADDVFGMVHPEDLPHVRQATEDALGERSELHVECRILRDGTDGPEVRWVAVSGRVERGDENALRIYGVLGDITERRAEDAARLRSQKREALGTLAGGIAHDFNNVISAIWSNASVAETEIRAGLSPETSIAEIKRGAERASDVVKRLLSFSREEKPERVPFDVVSVAREACELLRPTLASGVTLTAPDETGLPAVLGSSSQLHQVMVNLIGNAGDAAADGGGHVWLTADTVRFTSPTSGGSQADGALPAGRYVRVRVRDDGPGISASAITRIFDPFFTTKAAGDGTGLGLSAAQSIVRAHGGDIWADNAPGGAAGGGAIFTVLLPASDEPAAPADDDAGRSEIHGTAGRVPQVLYVDDDPALAKLASRALPLHGCGVAAFTDADEALAALRAAPDRFDALVVDLSMPGMGGLQLIDAARGIRPDLVMVVSSGLVSSADEARAAQLGVGAVLPKPVSIESIAAAVLQLSERQRADS